VYYYSVIVHLLIKQFGYLLQNHFLYLGLLAFGMFLITVLEHMQPFGSTAPSHVKFGSEIQCQVSLLNRIIDVAAFD